MSKDGAVCGPRPLGVCLGAMLALLAGCGSATMMLKQPVQDQCAGAGLQGCDRISEGVLKFIDGDKDGGREKILAGAAANSGEKIQAFAQRLETIKQLPGAGSFVAPVDEVIAMLKAPVSGAAAADGAAPNHDGATKSKAPADSSGAVASASQRSVPTGAAGFAFGASPAEAEAACKSGWVGNDEGAVCAVPAVPIGFPMSARMRFSDGQLTSVVLDARPQQAQLNGLWRALQRTLESKYGPPTATRKEATAIRVEWTMPDGFAIVLAAVEERVSATQRASHIEIYYDAPNVWLSKAAL